MAEHIDDLSARITALEILVSATIITLAEREANIPAFISKISERAKRDAENLRSSPTAKAALALPMEDDVARLVQNLAISSAGLTGHQGGSRSNS